MENKEIDIEEGSSPLVILLVILHRGVSIGHWVVNPSSNGVIIQLFIYYFTPYFS